MFLNAITATLPSNPSHRKLPPHSGSDVPPPDDGLDDTADAVDAELDDAPRGSGVGKLAPALGVGITGATVGIALGEVAPVPVSVISYAVPFKTTMTRELSARNFANAGLLVIKAKYASLPNSILIVVTPCVDGSNCVSVQVLLRDINVLSPTY